MTADSESVIVDCFRLNPILSSEELNTERDLKETATAGVNQPPTQFDIIMQKMEQMELQAWARDAEMETLWKQFQAVKMKNESQLYMQTWENNAASETQDPIARVQAMLEQSKKIENTQVYIERASKLSSCSWESKALSM